MEEVTNQEDVAYLVLLSDMLKYAIQYMGMEKNDSGKEGISECCVYECGIMN